MVIVIETAPPGPRARAQESVNTAYGLGMVHLELWRTVTEMLSRVDADGNQYL